MRRIVLDGTVVEAHRVGPDLVTLDGRTVDPDTVEHLPPCSPSKILAVHFNYQSRHDEMNRPVESAPTFFSKPPSSLVGHRGSVVRPRGCEST